MPSRISSSETRTTSSTRREQTSSPIAPATGERRASAIVGPGTAGTGWPASRAVRIAADSSGSTPMTCASGRRPLTAVAIPAISPPPPIGTMTVSTSGMSSTISRPTVPWPAAISGSSYGMDDHPARLGRDGAHPLQRLHAVGRLEVDGRAVAARGGDLERAGVGGHEHERVDALVTGRERQRLGVVSGRDRDRPEPSLLGRQGPQPVERAARLERPDPLEELGLEPDRRPAARRERGRGEHRRAVHPPGDRLRRSLDVGECRGFGHAQCSHNPKGRPDRP